MAYNENEAIRTQIAGGRMQGGLGGGKNWAGEPEQVNAVDYLKARAAKLENAVNIKSTSPQSEIEREVEELRRRLVEVEPKLVNHLHELVTMLEERLAGVRVSSVQADGSGETDGQDKELSPGSSLGQTIRGLRSNADLNLQSLAEVGVRLNRLRGEICL
jgi:hypothetical protein